MLNGTTRISPMQGEFVQGGYMRRRREKPGGLGEEKQALTRKEAAAVLGVSEGMMIKLVRLGQVAAIRIGRCVRIPRKEVERILREGIS